MKLPDDYTIRLVDLPVRVGGFINECPDGHVDVYINARLSHDGQYDAAEHEFDHWEHDDLHSDEDIKEVERRADRRAHKPLPPLKRASDLPRPAKRHDKVELKIRQERLDEWKHDVYLDMPTYDDL